MPTPPSASPEFPSISEPLTGQGRGSGAAIRQASRMLVDGDHPASWDGVEQLDLADIGDFRIAHGDIQGTLAKVEEQRGQFGTSWPSEAITR